MYTICETPLFTKYYPDYLTEQEYSEFKTFLSLNPDFGDVEPQTGGIRKIRWGGKGKGKQGGNRIIYYNRLESGQIWLLTIYGKSATDQLPKNVLRQIVEALNETF